MQYTTDQLIQLLEEARGYVHDAAMGAIWTKERYQKMKDFLERTFAFDVTDSKVVNKQPSRGKDVAKVLKKASSKPADTNGLTPAQVAWNLRVDGYSGIFLSVEEEVKNLREKDKLPYSRDFLRQVVKILRADQVTEDLVTTQPIHPDTIKNALEAAKKADKLAPTAVTPQTIDKVFGPSPKEKATDMLQHGYLSIRGSVDSEVQGLKKSGHQGSRDFLREVVKIIRSKQGISK